MAKQRDWESQFEKIEQLGEGGNAEVYRVKHKATGQEYALKDLVKGGLEKRSRFLEEIHIMREYGSTVTGILPIFYYSEDKYWYTMPIAMPVMKYIKIKKLNIKEIITYTITLCDTLIGLHKEGISHRDIKPSNIYFYDKKFYFGDFGLVDFPESENDFTKSDKGLGAIFTIAPEMKRNPKNADGKKADVFSFAKTVWMFLADDEKGFDGVYNYADPQFGLHYIKKYKDEHLVELEELLTDATNNDPSERPTISEFKDRLINWLAIYSDHYKSQLSDWTFLSHQLFGNTPPESSSWSDCKDIVRVLNIIGNTPAYNHMFFHNKGGLDFSNAELAAEGGCIKLYDTIGFCHIVKPRKLHFEGFKDNYRWNYFLLELDNLPPIFEPCVSDEEYLVEDVPAHYVSAQFAQYGVYDYDTGLPLPEGYRIVYRYTKGKFLIVMKAGPYNMINSTYDGRHGDCSCDEFRDYIVYLIDLYSKAYERIKEANLHEKYLDSEVERKILSISQFNRNPFKEECETEISTGPNLEEIRKSKSFINKNFLNLDFGSALTSYAPPGDPKIKFIFNFTPPGERASFLERLNGTNFSVCKDGKIRKINLKCEEEQCYCVYNREIAIHIKNLLEADMQKTLENNNLAPLESYEHCFSIELVKIGKPSHLFTKKEIEDIMRSADDRLSNQLVIDEDGYARIISDNTSGYLYPVRHESWDAGNVYVGKYSKLSTLEDNYISSLVGWLSYLETGRKQYIDYVDDTKDEKELIQRIKEYY